MDRPEHLIRLHDRASRGDVLSARDQAELHGWYDEQDRLEGRLIGRTNSQERVATLQAQLDAALIQLATVSRRVRELSAQNDDIRREIGDLQRLLAVALSTRPG